LSTITSSDEAVPVSNAPPAARGGPDPGRWLAAAVGLAAAWIVPLATHAVRLDALLPPLVLLALMSLGRGGVSLPDRFAVAFAQLFGAFCAAGLVISVWPWHLQPVPVAGCAFTGLVLVAVVTRRAPRLPWRLRGPDALVVAASAGVAVLAVVPFAARDLGGRLGIVALGEDFARHFLLYDMMGRFGGYAFLHAHAAAAYVPSAYGTGVTNYPQGTHFLYTVLNAFWRSSGRGGEAVSGMDFMLWCHLGTYVFLAFAVLWGARRVAGPGPGALRLLPVLGSVAVLVYLGDLVTVFLRGFPNELMGLALVAVLTAVLARPLRHTGEQVVTVVALLVGISFSYFLFLPYAMLGAALWALARRRVLWRRRGVVGVSLLASTLTLLTPVLNKPSGSGSLILQGGTAVRGDRPVAVALVLLAVVALVARRGLRVSSRRMMAVQLAVALLMVAVLAAYQYVMIGHTLYYFEKVLHMTTVVALVALGAAARLLPAPGPAAAGSVRRLAVRRLAVRRLGLGAAIIVAVAAFLAGLGGPAHLTPLGGGGLRYAVALDKGSPLGGRDAVRLTRRYPDGGGKVNVDLMHTPYANFYGTFFGSALQRNFADGSAWYELQDPRKAKTLGDLERMVLDSKVPVRFFVQYPKASFLVVDRDHPNRQRPGPGVDPAAYGDPAAPDNITAVEYLAGKYPDRVELVYAPPEWAH
jgi:hypothetical protein